MKVAIDMRIDNPVVRQKLDSDRGRGSIAATQVPVGRTSLHRLIQTQRVAVNDMFKELLPCGQITHSSQRNKQ
jgi:hypothetical protein